MIISHKYKFIFIKTRKTAGSSIELALAKICGDSDIITPLQNESEHMRAELYARGPQHYTLPFSEYKVTDWLSLARRFKLTVFSPHSPATFIKKKVRKEIWKDYFKFCFVRNPFDRAVSMYYFRTQALNDHPELDLGAHVAYTRDTVLTDWHIYTIRDQIAVDFVGRYESLAQDLETIAEKLGLPSSLDLPRANANYRTDRRHYSTILSASDRVRVENICAKEIAAFGYHW